MLKLKRMFLSLKRRFQARLTYLKQFIPVRFHGCLFLPLKDDHVYEAMKTELGFEENEIAFLNAFLSPGNIFWDVGANFGLYTLLSSRRIGNSGHILAIEPDPRNYTRLCVNLALNGLWRVKTRRLALGDRNAPCVEFISCSQGAYSGLKVGDVPGSIRHVRVRQTTLDTLAEKLGWPDVNLMKMDVEGAELLVLKGGERFFGHYPRPVVMCEFSDRRTIAFGYPALEIYEWLTQKDYVVFQITGSGCVTPMAVQNVYDYDNLVACPREKISLMKTHTPQ